MGCSSTNILQYIEEDFLLAIKTKFTGLYSSKNVNRRLAFSSYNLLPSSQYNLSTLNQAPQACQLYCLIQYTHSPAPQCVKQNQKSTAHYSLLNQNTCHLLGVCHQTVPHGSIIFTTGNLLELNCRTPPPPHLDSKCPHLATFPLLLELLAPIKVM